MEKMLLSRPVRLCQKMYPMMQWWADYLDEAEAKGMRAIAA